jgi:hydrogenase maturation protease
VVGTLVLGLGNILLRDEGVGVRVVEHLLEQYGFPEGVRALDGGTLGLDLLPYLEGVERLLVVDAVQARHPAGTLVRLVGNEIPIFLDTSRVSPHQDGLHKLLAVAMLKGYLPAEVIFWGVQIESLGVGLELSPTVAAQVGVLAEKVIEDLARWGIEVWRRSSSTPEPGSEGAAPSFQSYGGLWSASSI